MRDKVKAGLAVFLAVLQQQKMLITIGLFLGAGLKEDSSPLLELSMPRCHYEINIFMLYALYNSVYSFDVYVSLFI